VGAARRIDSDQHQGSGGGLLDGHAVSIHLGRQLAGSQLLARLRQDQIHIGIGLEIEIGEQRRAIAAGRVH
jgi:hypothetical protein